MRVKANPLQTSTFRLSALYLLFFLLSTLALLGYIYYNTVDLLERQNEETIGAEVAGLADQYGTQGLPGLLAAINRRVEAKSHMLLMLADRQGSYLAGNLHSPVISAYPDNQWIDFSIKPGDADATIGHQARGFNLQLPQDYQLIVGQDVEDLNQFLGVIRRAFYWGLALALAMGLGGGYLISRNFLRRVDAITEASRVIMNGDLSERMPIAGSGDELDRLAESLNEMLGKIEKLIQGMREVSSNVAHDLRTPLTRLRARIEAALRQENLNDYKTTMEQILADSDALLSTFNAVLSITQLESGEQAANLQVLDANEILEDVVELYAPLAEVNLGTLTLISAPGLYVRAKRELMAQALINLVDNAMKYGEGKSGGARIEVSGKKQGDEIVITVSDNGPGIPDKDKLRVLQRFVRLDESRSKPGNGLGLSLVASVANLLNGKITLKSNDPGLRAELHLPYSAYEA